MDTKVFRLLCRTGIHKWAYLQPKKSYTNGRFCLECARAEIYKDDYFSSGFDGYVQADDVDDMCRTFIKNRRNVIAGYKV
mgnify:CR=1 FL=1